MKKNREDLRAGFNNAANEVVKYFNNALDDFLAKNYRTRITEIDSQISEIRNMRLGKSEICKKLESAQTDCKLLISEIHRDYLNNADDCD